MSWDAIRDLTHRARNVIRRGYLLGVNADGKLLRGRVKTGDGIENVDLDIMHPAGFMSRLKPGPKVEVITADVNSDASKRVILAVIGDRANHPQVGEDEAMMYSPTDPKKNMKVSKSGGLNIDMDDAPIAMKTSEGLDIKAKTMDLLEGSISVDEEGNVTFKGNLTIGKNLTVKGNVVVTGTVTAADYITA